MSSLIKVKELINFLYGWYFKNLQTSRDESAALKKLFMHVLYELEHAIHFIKDMFKEA